MSVLFRNGQKPPQRALEIIVRYLNKVANPVYMGLISLEVGWSLARTEEMMELLEDRGVVRKLTPDDLRQRGYRSDANIYELIGKPELRKAHME